MFNNYIAKYKPSILRLFRGEPLEVAVQLTVTYGLRRSEVCGLRWDAIDFESDTIHICHTAVMNKGKVVYSDSTKTDSGNRVLPLTSNMQTYLQKVKRQQAENRELFGGAHIDSCYVCVHPNGAPIRPDYMTPHFQRRLKESGLPVIRFHDLRHLFVTTALENGMDVKTLSTIIGHVSAKTTLNVYTHVTDAMRQTAAAKIDRGIGKCEPPDGRGEGFPTQPPDTRPVATFESYKGKIRKSGTGCVTQINDHLWEGKFSPRWPDGKKHSCSVYASTEPECEEKLAELIRKMKAEIVEAKRLASAGKWVEAMALAVQKKARGARKAV